MATDPRELEQAMRTWFDGDTNKLAALFHDESDIFEWLRQSWKLA
jgi:hypothetical protein